MGLAENFSAIEERIVTACARAGRARESVRLLAVSKGMPPELINEAAQRGQIFFGESKSDITSHRMSDKNRVLNF